MILGIPNLNGKEAGTIFGEPCKKPDCKMYHAWSATWSKGKKPKYQNNMIVVGNQSCIQCKHFIGLDLYKADRIWQK